MKDFARVEEERSGVSGGSSTMPKTKMSHSIEEILKKPCWLPDRGAQTMTDTVTPDAGKKMNDESPKLNKYTGM